LNSSSIRNGFWTFRRCLALGTVAVATIAYGCGSSTDVTQGRIGDGSAAKKLDEKDLYTYVGQGKAKRKEAISIREKARLLREAEKKQ
jgi:hypothetical protein